MNEMCSGEKSKSKYFVYLLKDYKGKYFYIGRTKNLNIRIQEHRQNKNASPKKTYKVRRCIKEKGFLDFDYYTCESLTESKKLEKELIEKHKYQLVNIALGEKPRLKKAKKTRKSRSKQCPICLNWYKRLGQHKCKV